MNEKSHDYYENLLKQKGFTTISKSHESGLSRLYLINTDGKNAMRFELRESMRQKTMNKPYIGMEPIFVPFVQDYAIKRGLVVSEIEPAKRRAMKALYELLPTIEAENKRVSEQFMQLFFTIAQ
jgi:hypothetical protein